MKRTTYLLVTIFVVTLFALGCNDPAIEDLNIADPNDTSINPLDTIAEAEIISQLIIEEIEVLSIKSKDSSGNYWDVASNSQDQEAEGPDLFILVKTLDETINVTTENLNKSYIHNSYSWETNFDSCAPELNGAIFKNQSFPIQIPLNKIIKITLFDYDLLYNGGFYTDHDEIYSFLVNANEYLGNLNSSIFIYNEEDCSIVLRLKVQWI